MSAKNAILKAKIEGVIQELMVKTDAANVYVDDNTTLAAKLTSIIADIATKASTDDLTSGLATKAAASHTHAQSEVTGLTDALAKLASSESVTAAIDALRQEMLGDTPVEAYNTFTELAAYIAEHQEVSDALSAAIAGKANVEHTHDISDVTGLQDALNERVLTEDVIEEITNTTTENKTGKFSIDYPYNGITSGTTLTDYSHGYSGIVMYKVADGLDTEVVEAIYNNGTPGITYFSLYDTEGGGTSANAGNNITYNSMAKGVWNYFSGKIVFPYNAPVYFTVGDMGIYTSYEKNDESNGGGYSFLTGLEFKYTLTNTTTSEKIKEELLPDSISTGIAAKADQTDLDAEVTARTKADTALGNRITTLESNTHTHANKAELDLIASGDKAKWDDAAGKAHEHSNKAVLDGITAENVSAWNAKSDSSIYYSATEPANLTDKDLWVQLV